MITKYSELNPYRGEHEAPDKTSGAPLHALTPVYPEDIYSREGIRYYGDGVPYDSQSMAIIHAARNRPNMPVKVYRAVPKTVTTQEKIQEYVTHQKYILRTGKLPPGVDNWRNSSEYYDYLHDELEKLRALPEDVEQKVKINAGDWVTTSLQYAKEHGAGNVKKYRIISKTVPAKHLYSEGNSIHEWGYDPT